MLILDRYVLIKFIGTLFFSLAALCVIFLIVNLIENLDEFMDRGATLMVISKYYISYFPEILKNLTPVATLLSTLFTVGRLSNNNEITAMKSGSLSLYRLMAPFVIISIALSFGQLYFNGWIVPDANEKKNEIERKFLKKGSSGSSIHNLYFRDSPYRNVTMQYYNSERKSGNFVSIEDFNSETEPRLIQRFEARRMSWDSAGYGWLLINGVQKIIHPKNMEMIQFDTVEIDLRISHDQIVKLQRSPEEMNFDEYKEYIEALKMGGKDITEQLIEYHGNYAFPFANFIVILFGVPFASVRKKGGIAIQIAAAMVISFTYLVFTKISQAIGYSYELDPVLAGWSANILFLLLGIFVLFKTKT